MCAVVFSGRWMATKPMCFCGPCLEKDITLTISTKNTANSHRFALPKLCETCETLTRCVHRDNNPGQDTNDHEMTAMTDLQYGQGELRSVSRALCTWLSSSVVWGSLNKPSGAEGAEGGELQPFAEPC